MSFSSCTFLIYLDTLLCVCVRICRIISYRINIFCYTKLNYISFFSGCVDGSFMECVGLLPMEALSYMERKGVEFPDADELAVVCP